ncbi:hypothetical protein ABLT50_12180 [Acinetobacter calcoaceticus]|uniref:hypothetical protein n=1 Tax=Acinetobacter calcoaceticus TaxID=471 RepID=UPI0032193132
MINFTDSLQLGLQSALDRERNFTEIHDIFAALKEQLFLFSKGSVTLEMIIKNENSEENGESVDYLTTLEGLYEDKFLYVSPTHNLNENYQYLGTINFSPNGYPCTLESEGNQFDSIDKIGLEENIKKLISSPSTGQKLFGIMKMAGKI